MRHKFPLIKIIFLYYNSFVCGQSFFVLLKTS